MIVYYRFLLVLTLALSSCSKGASSDGAKTDKAVPPPVTSTAPLPAPTPAPAPTESNTAGANITISSLTPDPSQPLRIGSKVKVKAEVNYALPPQGGMIGMIVQGGNDTKPIGSTLKPVSGGSGKFATELEFVVPNAKNVVVHIPLYVKGESKSVRVLNKAYEVTK